MKKRIFSLALALVMALALLPASAMAAGGPFAGYLSSGKIETPMVKNLK